MAKRWMVEGGDDPTYTESPVIGALVAIVQRDPALAERPVLMPFLDTIGSGDRHLLDTLHEFLATDFEGVAQVLSHPMLKDGITDDLVAEIPLQYLALRDPDAAEAIRNVPWVRDGVTPDARGDLNWEVQAIG